MMMIVNYMMLVIMMLIDDYVDSGHDDDYHDDDGLLTFIVYIYCITMKVMKVVKQDGILVKIGGRNVIIILLKIKYLG